jgi:hypothetical protein
MPECLEKVNPATVFLPLVKCFSPASKSVRCRWSRGSQAMPTFDYNSILKGVCTARELNNLSTSIEKYYIFLEPVTL